MHYNSNSEFGNYGKWSCCFDRSGVFFFYRCYPFFWNHFQDRAAPPHSFASSPRSGRRPSCKPSRRRQWSGGSRWRWTVADRSWSVWSRREPRRCAIWSANTTSKRSDCTSDPFPPPLLLVFWGARVRALTTVIVFAKLVSTVSRLSAKTVGWWIIYLLGGEWGAFTPHFFSSHLRFFGLRDICTVSAWSWSARAQGSVWRRLMMKMHIYHQSYGCNSHTLADRGAWKTKSVPETGSPGTDKR